MGDHNAWCQTASLKYSDLQPLVSGWKGASNIGMMQWDQVELNISHPCVLEAPGALADNCNTLLPNFWKQQ